MSPLRLPACLLAVIALSGCSGPTSPDDHAATAHDHPGIDADAVPEGVARQYAMVDTEIAEHGGQTTSGEWRVAYVVGPAKSWQVPDGDDYTMRDPAAGETNHLEIIPFEAASGRIVPDVPIRLEVIDASGDVVQAEDLNFYFSDFFHYANNFAIPEAGQYTLRATLGAPTFLRHNHAGHTGGTPALAEGTTVEFPDVQITPGS